MAGRETNENRLNNRIRRVGSEAKINVKAIAFGAPSTHAQGKGIGRGAPIFAGSSLLTNSLDPGGDSGLARILYLLGSRLEELSVSPEPTF